jgi:uncharacterized membrane protein YhhN
MFFLACSVAALASAAGHLVAVYRGPRGLGYVCKPLTTTLLILIAAVAEPAPSPFYKAAVVAGLACSLAGDVLLMLPVERFIAGLVSFLLAHLCYSAAFASQAGAPASVAGAGAWALYGAVLIRVLWPHLGRLRVPVVVYGLVLLGMGWMAAEQVRAAGTYRAWAALAGAVLFALSDAILAWNRFVRPFPAAQLLIMGTYVPAQWLIALSAYAW